MGWTKHRDAVDAHERELRRTYLVLSKLLKGVTRMSPSRALDSWRAMSSYAKMARALSGSSRNADMIEINLGEAIDALQGFDGHIEITFRCK